MTFNHEIWCTCRKCGHTFDARAYMGFVCPVCGAGTKQQKTKQ